MVYLKLKSTGHTTAAAIRSALNQIRLSQDKVFVKIVQEEYSGIFGHKEAIVEITYDEEESRQAHIDEATAFFTVYEYDSLVIKPPAPFYQKQYIKTDEERFKHLKEYLERCNIVDYDEEVFKKIVSDPSCQGQFSTIKTFLTVPLNEEKGSLHLFISEDLMSCKAIIFHHGEIHYEDVLKVLYEMGCVKGIKIKALKRVVEKKLSGFFEVASGKEPIQPLPAPIECFFETEEDKLISGMENLLKVDTRSVKKITIAERNQLIMKIGSAIPGVNGYRIDGSIIKCNDIDPSLSQVKMGENVSISDNGKEIYAKKNGHIKWKATERFIDIEAIYTVNGNVDFNEGNIIGFVGRVIILGDVKPKFSVSAEGDIEIKGSVEDAIVESINGSVYINGSIVHTNEGYIRAKETVQASIATNASIRAGKIIIHKEVMNSQLQADDEVNIIGTPGVLMGGETQAKKCVKANVIGSENWVDTRVMAGDVQEFRKKILNLQNKISDKKAELEDKEGVIKLLERRKAASSLSENQQLQLEELLEKVEMINEDISFYEGEISQLLSEIETRKDAYIHILKKVYPKVDMKVYDAYVRIDTEELSTGFSCLDGAIKRYPL